MTDLEIIDMYQQLHDSEVVGFHANLSGGEVIRICRRHGVPIARRGGFGRGARAAHTVLGQWRGKLTEEQIVLRYKAGESGITLAKAAAISPHAVYRLLKSRDVTLRPGAPEQIRLGMLDPPRRAAQRAARRAQRG